MKKRGDDITFLRRIIPGGADESYGIEVAKLAGVTGAVEMCIRDRGTTTLSTTNGSLHLTQVKAGRLERCV